MKVIIVGGVAGGASAAARLRRNDENAEIIILERGDYISYANCGLPYFIGGEIKQKSALTLQTPQSFFNRFNIDVRVKNEVLSINKDKKTVTVKNIGENTIFEESYDKLIISPGAEPIIPPIEGIKSEKIFTLRNIPDTYKIDEFIKKNNPKKAVVVGGGYIGVEMAENLKNVGIDVTIVELAEHLIGPLDFDMACDVHNYIKTKGINYILNNGVKSFEEINDLIKVNLNTGEIEVDFVIMSVGVRPDTKFLSNSGIELDKRGSIVVNDHMQTNVENIYAVGDAVQVKNFVTDSFDFIPLAGPANKQGRIAADNICGFNKKYKKTQGTAILKIFDMTVATTGINEKTAKNNGFNFEKVFLFSSSHASYYPGANNMSIKILFEKVTGRILGAQLVGFDGVDKRCDIFAQAIRNNLTAEDLTELELAYAPPFSSAKDPTNMAGYVIENVLTEKVKQYHWHDVENISKNKNNFMLDVRTEYEYALGNIEGTKNIPVDELRNRLNELDKNKTIYVNCQSGLRSYIACRILSQNGFDCYNLAGGYRLYHSVIQNIDYDYIPCHPCGVKI